MIQIFFNLKGNCPLKTQDQCYPLYYHLLSTGVLPTCWGPVSIIYSLCPPHMLGSCVLSYTLSILPTFWGPVFYHVISVSSPHAGVLCSIIYSLSSPHAGDLCPIIYSVFPKCWDHVFYHLFSPSSPHAGALCSIIYSPSSPHAGVLCSIIYSLHPPHMLMSCVLSSTLSFLPTCWGPVFYHLLSPSSPQ